MLRFFLALPFAVSLILCQCVLPHHASAQDAYQNALDALDKAEKMHATKQEAGALNNPFADKSLLNDPILFTENIHAMLQQVMNVEKLSVDEVLQWDKRCKSRDNSEEYVKLGMDYQIECSFFESDGGLISAYFGLNAEGRVIFITIGARMLDATEKFRNIIAKEIEKFNATYGSNYQQGRDNFQIWKGKPGYSILASPDLGITSGLDAGFVRDDFLAVILK